MKVPFMKKMGIILSLGLLIGFVGCNANPAEEITLTEITLDTTGVKTEFTVGEGFTTDGLIVTAVYSDETTKEVTGWTTSGFDSSAPVESQTITVSYTENEITKTAAYTVSIKTKNKDDNENPPVKKEYTLSYETQFGTVPSKKVEEGYKLTAEDLPALSQKGYIFVGWNKNIGDEITADTKIQATWKKIESAFDVTLDKNNEIQLTFTSTKANEICFTAPEGYASYQWYCDGKEITELEDKNQNVCRIATDKLENENPFSRSELLPYFKDGKHEILVIVKDSNSVYNSAKATFYVYN